MPSSRSAARLALSVALGLTLAVGAELVAWSATAADPAPVEDYARYDPQDTCRPKAKPGAVALQSWLVRTYGGRSGPIGRSCAGSSVSEHKEGRAVDWMLNAARKRDRRKAARFLRAAFATGPTGEPAELARRMGIMYVIFNDRIYASYRSFEARRYVSSSCRGKRLRRCSKTLRHRDHLHLSLSRAGGAGATSWYVDRAS